MSRRRDGLALLRFQLHAGVRVALRTMVPVLMALVGASVLYGSPAVLVGAVAALLFPPAPSLGSALLAAALCFAVARAAARRLTLGLGGWIRHLPATPTSHRRAVTAGLVVVQGPVLTLLLASGLVAGAGGSAATWLRLLGLPLLAWSASVSALSVGRSRWSAAAAAVAAWGGVGWGLALATGLLFAAERMSGEVASGTGRGSGSQRRREVVLSGTEGNGATRAAAFWLVVSARAVGARIASAWLISLLAAAPAALFLRNNVLTPGQEEAAARLGSLTAAVLAMAVLAEVLVERRPPWPWVRALPWSGRMRAGLDAALLGAAALPCLAPALIWPAVMPSLVATLPWLALRGAAEVRRAPGHQGGVASLLLEGGLVAGIVTLVPWISAGLLALTPLALALAGARDQGQEVSRWHELHHVAAGDPLSWSER